MATVEYLNYDVVSDSSWSVDDDDLFEKADNADLAEEDFGSFEVDDNQSILEAAEERGYNWPYGCRSGACFSCGSYLYSGSVNQESQMVLSEEEVSDGYRVTCIGEPAEDHIQIVYNAQQKLYD